jgi:sulfite exporter TauE/SafE
MCGPLVVALPGSQKSLWGHFAYHTGRLLTYAVIGAGLAGMGGSMVRLGGLSEDAALLWTTRIQISLSLFAATFLLLFGLVRLGVLNEPQWMAKVNPNRLPGYRTALHNILNHGNLLWLFVMGLLLGLLPCGLSYAAFARSFAAQQMLIGARWMALFGFGTLPGLLLLGMGVGAFWRRYQLQMEMVSGLIMIGMAVALVADALSAVI